MKNLVLLILLIPCLLNAQIPEQANLLFQWDDPDLPGSAIFDNTYNEIWGVVANNREIAVIGSTAGTHFFDVTDPVNSIELTEAFVPGEVTGPIIIHRDYHDYQCYLYAVADEGQSSLQIIDISNLPNTTVVEYDSDELFQRVHNIFIDTATAKLYACAVGSSTFYSPLRIYSLEDPLNPVLLDAYGVVDGVSLPVIHDIYVENDIAYMNGSNDGLFIADFSDMDNPQMITALPTYPDQGYNHSGWLSEDGNYYFLADETHGLDIKVIDVSDPQNLEVVTTFNAESADFQSIPHNLIVRGNYLYTSYYYDGLQVFDISDPENPKRAAFYDTYPGTNIGSYEGAWGVYPLLPSGNILISDMQTGLYVFEAIDPNITNPQFDPLGSTTNCAGGITSVSAPELNSLSVEIFPVPASEQITLRINPDLESQVQIQLTDLTGRRLLSYGEFNLTASVNTINLNLPQAIPSGLYFIEIQGNNTSFVEKIIKQ